MSVAARTLFESARVRPRSFLLALCVAVSLTGPIYGKAPTVSNSNANDLFQEKPSSAARKAEGTNGECLVDGSVYPRSAEGINAALAACSPGTTHLAGGAYQNLSSSINVGCGQTLVFDGNPTLSFALRGVAPAFIYNRAQCGAYENGVSGTAMIDMQHSGGTVFELCVGGNIGGVFGPSNGAINVANQTGNTIDFGPCSSAYSVGNFTVQNITSKNVPGDLIHIITNNYSGRQGSAPFVEVVTFSHIGAIDVAGRVIHIEANASGSEVNVNGILFEHIFATNSTRARNPAAPIYIQSTFTTANSISFQVRDSVLGFPFASGAITLVDSDGRPETDNSLLSVILDGVDAQGGTLATIPFSPTILKNAPVTSDLQYRGATNATSFRPFYSQAFASIQQNSAKAGMLRLAPADAVCWRNDKNSADLCMSKTASDQIVMPGPLLDVELAKPKIGGGSMLNGVYRESGLAPDTPFTAIGPRNCQERSLKLPGAARTGVAAVSPAGSVGDVNLNWSAYVSAADTVTVRICNPSAGIVTPSVTSWNVLVVQ